MNSDYKSGRPFYHLGLVSDDGSAFVLGVPTDRGAARLHLTCEDPTGELVFGQSPLTPLLPDEVAEVDVEFEEARAEDLGGNVGFARPITVTASSTAPKESKLTADDAAASDNFGYSVAVSGDTIVVGALFGNDDAGSDSGSAYVFFE